MMDRNPTPTSRLSVMGEALRRVLGGPAPAPAAPTPRPARSRPRGNGAPELRHIAGTMKPRRDERNRRRAAAGMDPLPKMRHPQARKLARQRREAQEAGR